ncbi:uncharacterized protein STEHIDRAFT_163453 [Stereum hirsutum FP-91666 SS1]|uniref:Uncharacterized protein n=1 Tax=Stereum hirsutum (strain FP-91666) TaxID=721885 RepID=R7RWE8_STEHR|nr:uncharacterized protein STEHIDRAFT_163453 [Stereum hirsutum FP-91666 SS1]EIM79629.1 hypothetical protein STEHIDRAFT_163453 [Stereum hirsutum FP-91666 SS1]
MSKIEDLWWMGDRDPSILCGWCNLRMTALYAGSVARRYVTGLVWALSVVNLIIFIVGAAQLAHLPTSALTEELEEALSFLGCGVDNYLSSFVYAPFVLPSLTLQFHRRRSGQGALFHPRFQHEDASYLEFTAYSTAWIVSLVYDAVVFCLTVNKYLNLGWSNPRTLWRVMLQDSITYFSALLLVNLANILVLLYAQEITRGTATTLTKL